MKQKVLKKAQKGIQVSDTTVPAKKETKEKSKKSKNTFSEVAYAQVPEKPYYPSSKGSIDSNKKMKSIDPFEDKRKLMTYHGVLTRLQQKELDDFKASFKKKNGGAVKPKKKK